MSDTLNTALARSIAKQHIQHRKSESIRIHGLGVVYHKVSHKPKALMINYDLWRKCGKGRRLISSNRQKQIMLKDMKSNHRIELFVRPLMIVSGLREFST